MAKSPVMLAAALMMGATALITPAQAVIQSQENTQQVQEDQASSLLANKEQSQNHRRRCWRRFGKTYCRNEHSSDWSSRSRQQKFEERHKRDKKRSLRIWDKKNQQRKVEEERRKVEKERRKIAKERRKIEKERERRFRERRRFEKKRRFEDQHHKDDDSLRSRRRHRDYDHGRKSKHRKVFFDRWFKHDDD